MFKYNYYPVTPTYFYYSMYPYYHTNSIHSIDGLCDLFKNNSWYGTDLNTILHTYSGASLIKNMKLICETYRDYIEDYLYIYSNENKTQYTNDYNHYVDTVIKFCESLGVPDITPKHHKIDEALTCDFKQYSERSNSWVDGGSTDTFVVDYLVQFLAYVIGCHDIDGSGAYHLNYMWQAGIKFIDLFRQQGTMGISKYKNDQNDVELCYSSLNNIVFYAGQIYCYINGGKMSNH